MNVIIKNELLEELEKLDETKQRRVLDFAQSLRMERPRGTPGKEFLKHAGLFPKEDIEEIERAIEEDCEQVYPSEW